MTKQEVVAAVYEGKLVECSEDEYKTEIRNVLREIAVRWIEADQISRAVIALEEVKRLDEMYL